MERAGPKTVQKLFDGTNPEAECAGKTRPTDHEWYVYRRVKGPGPYPSFIAPSRSLLFVVCRNCGATGRVDVTESEHDWAKAEAEAALAHPYAMPSPDWQRVRNMKPRNPDEWDEFTEGRARPPQRK